MVKFICNYMNELKELIEENKVVVDYIKVFSICNKPIGYEWTLENGHNLMLHGLIEIGQCSGTIDYLDNENLDKVIEYVKKSKTPYLSVHMDVSKTKKQIELFNSMDFTSYKQKVIETFANNINKMREIFEKDIVVEINGMAKDKMISFCREPEVINEILKKAKCNLLFDLAHARCISRLLGISLEEFIDKIDMEKVVEMHVNGVRKNEDDSVLDKHLKLHEEDYLKIEELLTKYPNIKALTLEYGPMEYIDDNTAFVCEDKVNKYAKEELYEQIIRLKEIIKKI